MIRHIFYALLSSMFLSTGCNERHSKAAAPTTSTGGRIVGGAFENPGYTYLNMPDKIGSTDTSAGWEQTGDKLLLTGIVFKADGQTPAANVLVYYYHTNMAGRYVHQAEEPRSMTPNNLGQTHGYIRGWVKTDRAGKYFIYTVRPGTYPSRSEPAHVHVTVKEPNDINEYYIDEFVFDDDPLLTSAKRQQLENRGGSGILRLVKKDDLFIGERNIMLGLHIPGYPQPIDKQMISGKAIGEDVVSFTPFHAWGPDKGSRTCPVCKYGWYHGILYCVGKNSDWADVKNWLKFFDIESSLREKYLKVYFVYGDPADYSKDAREKLLNDLGDNLQLKNVALTFVPSFTDTDSDINENHISPEAGNTIIVYKRSKIIGKFINTAASADNFKAVQTILNNSINEYFYLD